MAKSKSVFKFQGTLAGLTFVRSTVNGDHVRAKRGTYKKATLNAALKKSSAKLKDANVPAKIFKDAIEPYRGYLKDGTLWQRLLSSFRVQMKENATPDFQVLTGIEIHSRYKLERFLQLRPAISTDSKKTLLEVDLHYETPIFGRSKYVDGYRLTVIAVFPDLKKKSAKTVSITSNIVRLQDPENDFHASLSIPAHAKTCVVCVKIEGCSEGAVANTPAVQGLRVVGAENF
jgi:hypothetical protein